MGSAHTPGPWRYELIESGAVIRAGAQPFASAVAFIADSNFANREPDAKLISAAPDMADALQAFLLAFPHSADHTLDAQQREAVKSASAALRKAGRLE